MGLPQNGWFIVKYPVKMNDLGVLPIAGHLHMVSLWHQIYEYVDVT